MPLPLPNLDDHSYEELLNEARSLIAIEYPAWTDHNPSDTGIILLELFAWLTEMVLYRVNTLPDQNYEVFLSLLQGTDLSIPRESNTTDPAIRHAQLQSEIRSTVLKLRQRYRAVTPGDYEKLVLEDWPHISIQELFWVLYGDDSEPRATPISALSSTQLKQIADDIQAKSSLTIRSELLALCQDNNTSASTLFLEITSTQLSHYRVKTAKCLLQPNGHVDLVILSQESHTTPAQLSPLFCKLLEIWLDQRRLLTTYVHVEPPTYVPLQLRAWLYLNDDANPDDVLKNANQKAKDFFAPLVSSTSNPAIAWKLGKNIYISEIYELLDSVLGVDYVKGIILVQPSTSNSANTNRNQLSKRVEQDKLEIEVDSTDGLEQGDLIQIEREFYQIDKVINKKNFSLKQPLISTHEAGTNVVKLPASSREILTNERELIGFTLQEKELVDITIDNNSFILIERGLQA